MLPSALLTLGTEPTYLGAVLSEMGRPPVMGSLEPRALHDATVEVPLLLKPQGGLLIPGEDAVAVRNERAAGGLIANILRGPALGTCFDRLKHLAGRTAQAGHPFQLFLDLRSNDLRKLPWELLEAIEPAGFLGHDLRVAHITEGSVAANVQGLQLEIDLWVPDARDPICDHVAAQLRQTLAGLPRTSLVNITEVQSDRSHLDVYRILHVVGHGEEALEQLLLTIGEGRALAPDSLSRWLKPLSSNAQLVVLDVCEAASGEMAPGDVPAWRLVKAGFPSCIAPRLPFASEASMLFARGLYGALANGFSLADAVQEGRRQLTGFSLAHPSCRWWNPVLTVSDTRYATEIALRISSPLPGWSAGAPDVEAILSTAAKLARSQGFLGLEHIALALARATNVSANILLLQPFLLEMGRELASYGIGALSDIVPTIRSTELGKTLPGLFSAEDLLTALLAVPWVAAELASHAPRLAASKNAGRETVPVARVQLVNLIQAREQDGLAFEVERGPEDGRVLVLRQPGDVLGRWDPTINEAQDARLFRQERPQDQAVSRRHVLYRGGRQLEALAPVRTWMQGAAGDPMLGLFEVKPGDLLLLGAATRLRVR